MDIVKRLAAICGIGAVLLIVLLVIARRPPEAKEERAPVFQAFTVDGEYMSIRDYTVNPSVLCFWILDDEDASGKEAVAAVSTLWANPEVPGMVPVAINLNASQDEMAKFVKETGTTIPVLHMGSDAERLQEINTLYHLSERKLPRFVFVRRNGNIAADVEGPHTAEELKEIALDVGLTE